MTIENKIATIHTGISERIFYAFSKQNMTCRDGICEAVDNAIAAALPGHKAEVCIAMAGTHDNSSVYIAIADKSCGMGPDGLENCLKLGSNEVPGSTLNFYGIGMDNALATLSGGGPDWHIYSHKPGESVYYHVHGPMAPDMPVYACPTLELPEGMHPSFDCPSTVILVKVPMYVAQTLQQRGTSNDLATLRACLVEHLAVAYRCYLGVNSATMEAQAKIAVSIGEDVVFVPAIQIPAIIEDKNRNHFQVEVDGQLVDIDYTFGQLDEEARNHLINGVRCRDHYQHNTRTQGIDIILNNRVIATSMFDEIWKNEQGEPLARHPSYNDFVGELTIHNAPPSAFPPVCNKTGIHPCDRNWCNLLGLLGQYPPPHDNRLCSEKDLQEALVRNIQANTDEHEILSEVSVWDSGTRMDIVEKWDSHFVIYELKIGSAAPINLYQLKMYWDGCLAQGVQPTKAVLVVKSYSPTLFAMAEAMNQMPAPPMPDGTPSLPYRFTIVTHEEKGLVASSDENS